MHYRYPANRSTYYLETNQPILSQEDIDGDGRLVVGTHHELDDDVIGFLKSLPGTAAGVAMRSAQLTSYQCRRQLRNENNYPAQLPETLYDKRGAEVVTYSNVLSHINDEWFNALPHGKRRTGSVEIEADWLSEQRVAQITGLNFSQLSALYVAAVNLLYTVSEKDLIECDRDVHVLGEGSIKLDNKAKRPSSTAVFYPAQS